MKRKKKLIIALVEIQKDGLSAYINLDEHIVSSAGETLYELKKNLEEAYHLFLEAAYDRNYDASNYENVIIELRLDVKQVFSFYKSINISGFASYSGINRSLLNQYAKGIKNPSEKQSIRILKGLHSLGRELTQIYTL